MSTAPANVEAYFIALLILVPTFGMISGVNLWHYIFSVLGPSYELDLTREENQAPPVNNFLIFFFDLICLCSPIYLYMEAGSEDLGLAEDRGAKIITAMAIYTVAGLINFCYKLYFFFNTKILLRIDLVSNWETSWVKSAHQALFIVQLMTFWAIVIGCLCALYLPGGWRSDTPSNLIITSGIIILANSCISCWTRSANVHKNGLKMLENKDSSGVVNGDEILYAVTPTTKILTTKAIKLNTNENIIKNLPDKEETVMLGNLEINKNSVEGAMLIKTSDHFRTPNVAIRKVFNNTYGMLARDAIEVDNNFNDSLGGTVFNVPTVVPTAKKMVGTFSNYNPNNSGPFDKTLLNVNVLKDSRWDDNPSRLVHHFVSTVKNFDYMKHGYFAFTDDVWSVSHGIGIHTNFTRDFIIPYVIFLNFMYTYFFFDVMWGNLVWSISTLVPLLLVWNGIFSQFWEIHLKCSLLVWAMIFLTKTVVPAGNNDFITNSTVWNNTEYYPGLCSTGCDNLNESVYLYIISVVCIVVSIGYFFYDIGLIIKSYDINIMTLKKNFEEGDRSD